MNEMILTYFIIQLAVQFVLWSQISKPLCWINSFFVNKYIFKYMFQILLWQFFFCNIAISVLVKYFTADGAMAGMTNLGASAILGFYQTYQAYKITKVLPYQN